MTYPELKIALDIGDFETVLSSLTNKYSIVDSKYNGCYFIVCDDGDVHCFDEDGKEHEIDCIPYGCFSLAKTDLKKIIIPKTAKSIGRRAFWRSGFTSVMIPNSVTSIDDSVFWCCIELIDVTIPNTVTSIGWSIFYGCKRLTSVTIGSGVTSIGDWTFKNCDSLKSVLFKDKTIEQIKTMDYYPWGIEDESIIQTEL